jgi:DNA invertase Pin-like site-specific DNA recombinase
MRAVAYARVSTEEQAVEGVSLEAQAAKLRAYALVRGLELVELHEDQGVSGGKALEDRPAGKALLENVQAGRVDAVIAVKLDRLFRNATDCLAVADRWSKRKVALHLVDMGGQAVDTGSAVGRFFFLMLAGLAEMERNLVRERTKAALAHQAAQGRRVGTVPLGFSVGEGGMLEVNHDERLALEGLVALRASGLSIRRVAAEMNAAGVWARGKRWHPTTVARMLARHRKLA